MRRSAWDVRRGLILVPKNAPFRDHENSFAGHVPPMWYEKHAQMVRLCLLCKEYTSYYRKLATETLQIQHEERQEH